MNTKFTLDLRQRPSGGCIKLKKGMFFLLMGIFALTGVSCGDDSSDPEVVTIEDLKSPADLKILDRGDGHIVLTWINRNLEDDFDGFNVYGVKATASELGVTEGVPLQLLDSDGEANEAAKDVLQKMHFNLEADDPFALESGAPAEEGDKKFSFLPIHKKGEDDPILPTCRPDGDGVCTSTEGDFTEEQIQAAAKSLVTTLDIKDYGYDLEVGSTYCFVVLSTMDQGTEVSAGSSNFDCIQPKRTLNMTVKQPNSSNKGVGVTMDEAFIAACETAGACTAVDTSATDVDGITANSGFVGTTDSGPLTFEWTDDVANITTTTDVTIKRLGYFEAGFSDVDVPESGNIPKLPSDFGSQTVVIEGGYFTAGRSIVLYQGYMYVVAIKIDDSTYYEHLMWVSGDPEAITTGFEVQWRLNTVPVSYAE